MICKECGCPYDTNLPSCPECGCPNDSVASATEAKDDSMLCPYCGAPVDGWKVCQWCGKPLAEGMEQEEHESISSEARNVAEEEVEQTMDESAIVSETPLSEHRNDEPSQPVDRNNKKRLNPKYILLPAGALIIAFICVIIVRNVGDDDYEQYDIEAESSRASGRRVYSCAYDGFVNMRDAASYSAAKIGEFRNGPEGAILLEEVGDWVKIDVNGLAGFVPSKYVREKPTVAYTGDIAMDWLEGMWSSPGGYITTIFNNGTYEHGYDYPTERGTYMMQNKDEIVFTPLWIDPGLLDDDTDNAERFKDYTLKITNRTGKEMSQFQDGYVTPYHKMDFMTPEDSEEYDESWGDGMMTIGTFRSLGRDVLRRIEEIEKRGHRAF